MDQQTSKKLAAERWKILRKAILAARYGKNNGMISLERQNGRSLASVRRFSSFNLFQVTQPSGDRGELNSEASRDQGASCIQGRWLRYEYRDSSVSVAPVVKHLTDSTSLEAMMGFNNTGNVCIWPSEEIMAYYCLKHVRTFRGCSVCEIGCGMTALAGVMLACTQQLSEVLLTDGNQTSVENVKEILSLNSDQFGSTRVSADVLVWDVTFTRSASAYDSKFDFIICADCLFFEDVHNELVRVLLKLLKPTGTALIFAPERSGTLNTFCSVAKEHFSIERSIQYDDLIWQKHQEAQSNEFYSTDLHYPLLLTLHPL